MSKLNKAKTYYRTHLQPEFGEPQGCSATELERLEQEVGHPLPAAYREFLLWMGDDKDGVLSGSEWFLGDVAENTKYVNELLGENDIDWRPAGPVLAFFCHQGYMIAWFDLPAEEEDPPCYFYSEGKEMKVPEKKEKFSEFLLTELEGIVAARTR